MRDLSRDRALLSINSMTVKAWSLQQLIEGCARAGISAISPWRDIVQACGAERAGKLIRAHGMTVTGLCDELGEGAGVAVDTYHVWWDPDLKHEIARAGKKILAYHVNDWLLPTSDLLLDRGMMGDGVIDLRAIRAMVEAGGYRGHCEVEILSANNWWTRDPDEVVRICIERHQTVV